MKTQIVTVDGRRGSVFEGELPDTFCFVPQECLVDAVEGLRVDEIEYVHSGWDVRNMRFSEVTDGQHLFPKWRCPVVDLEAAPVRTFLERIKTVRAS